MIIGPVKRTIFALFNHKQELGLLINMELHTLDDLYEDFEIGRWKVRKFVLPIRLPLGHREYYMGSNRINRCLGGE